MLPKPATAGPAAFTTALDPIAIDPDLKNAGIGVIDFTRAAGPDIWLHEPVGNTSFRIGSASKIAILLAAVQLRLDVRRILKLGIISTGTEFDELYRNKELWKKAKPPQTEMQQIASSASAPLISEIFDFAKHPVDFITPDPDPGNHTDLAVQDAIIAKLPPSPHGGRHLPWGKWSSLTFSERLWLTGCLSDNVAATACMSQIGVPYIKAVQQSWGLADPANGMSLFASNGYDGIPPGKRHHADVDPPRPLTHPKAIDVKDFFWDTDTKSYSQRSTVPGSAAALSAYMIALMGNGFFDNPDLGLLARPIDRIASNAAIRDNLADGRHNAIPSFLVNRGIKSAHTKINRQINKIGILQKSLGAKAPLLCEFVYVETEEDPPPAAPARSAMKYGVVAVGIIAKDAAGSDAIAKAKKLGSTVHTALLSLPP
jgi:hypothetical protein